MFFLPTSCFVVEVPLWESSALSLLGPWTPFPCKWATVPDWKPWWWGICMIPPAVTLVKVSFQLLCKMTCSVSFYGGDTHHHQFGLRNSPVFCASFIRIFFGAGHQMFSLPGYTWSNHMRESLPDSCMIVWQGVGHCLTSGRPTFGSLVTGVVLSLKLQTDIHTAHYIDSKVDAVVFLVSTHHARSFTMNHAELLVPHHLHKLQFTSIYNFTMTQ